MSYPIQNLIEVARFATQRLQDKSKRGTQLLTPQASIEIEKFPASELSSLREDLLQADLDSRQVAELIRGFLAERGYGVSFADSHSAAMRPGVLFGSLQRMQETLEKVAVLM